MPISRVPALGPRGEGWVVLQALALLGVAASALFDAEWPDALETPLAVVGVASALAGAVLLAAGARALGPSLTPLPRPRPGGALRGDGVYGLVRHPIYGGVLLLAAGWTLAVAPLAGVPTAVLAVVFDLKARREEAWLCERYPEYGAYRTRTPRRFLPWLV
jgi:protein-S-isoprenylcysteine O-methyltransferase Ste14